MATHTEAGPKRGFSRHGRLAGTQAGLPSSARRPTSADEDASLPAPGEDDIWSTDDDWPGHFGAARLGIP